MSDKYAGAAWNAIMEEETKESVMEMLFDAKAKVRELEQALRRATMALQWAHSQKPDPDYPAVIEQSLAALHVPDKAVKNG